jgi:anaerobic selenocysteine-containing dehydrogenase
MGQPIAESCYSFRVSPWGQSDVTHGRAAQSIWPINKNRAQETLAAQVRRIAAEMFAKGRASTLGRAWVKHNSQSESADLGASCIRDVGQAGTGANIFRGHTNVQDATDLGFDVTTTLAQCRLRGRPSFDSDMQV